MERSPTGQHWSQRQVSGCGEGPRSERKPRSRAFFIFTSNQAQGEVLENTGGSLPEFVSILKWMPAQLVLAMPNTEFVGIFSLIVGSEVMNRLYEAFASSCLCY